MRKKIIRKKMVAKPVEAPVVTLDSIDPKPEPVAAPKPAPVASPESAPDRLAPGKPMPDGFVNPECGDHGHFCVDLQGNYAPDWVSLIVHGHDSLSGRLPFNVMENGRAKRFYLRVDTWADVPPQILSTLKTLNYDEIKMDYDAKGSVVQGSAEYVKRRTPAFHYSYHPSA